MVPVSHELDLRERVLGVRRTVPLLDGRHVPYVPNGNGLSTELRLASSSDATARGHIELRLPDGEPAEVAILR